MEFTKEKSNLLKILNFIMTCFMIAYHTGGINSSLAISSNDVILNNFVTRLFDSMGIIVMSYFFTVTGFLLFNNLNFKNYKNKIHKRIFSLLIPYILWQVIIAIKLVFQQKYNFSLLSFLKLTFCFKRWPLDGALWYIYAIFILAVLSPILLLLFKNKKSGIISLIIIFFLLCGRTNIFTAPIIQKIMNWGYISNLLFYLPAFLMGSFYGKFHNDIKKERSLYILIILFEALCLEGVWGSILSTTLILMLPLLFLIELPTIPRLVNLNIYKLTFLMYAIHQPLISDIKPFIEKIYINLGIPIFLDNILIRLTLILIVIGVAFIIYFILKKICPSLLKVLCGGRVENKIKTTA